MKIKKFNESSNQNIELIKETISDFLDDVNINTIDVKESSLNIASLGEIILKMEKIEVHPSMIQSICHDKNVIGNKAYNDSLKLFGPLVRKYMKWKSIDVEIKFNSGLQSRKEIIHKLEDSIKVIESYGFIMTNFEKYQYHYVPKEKMISLIFCHE